MAHPRNQRVQATFAIVVTTDTRTPETDESGILAKALLEEKNHNVAIHILVENDKEKIRNALNTLLTNKKIQVIITSGGTGIGKKDKTIDVATELFEKEIPGFGEFLRRLSFEKIGGPGIISRATAGVKNGKLIFCLPGSKNAIRTALNQIIMPTIGHMLWELER